jgi:signal transduction histidine kinase
MAKRDETGILSGFVQRTRDMTDRECAAEELRAKEVTIRGLFRIATTLTRTLDLEAILDLLNFESMKLVGAESGCAGLRVEQALTCQSYFEGPVARKVILTWPSGVGVPGWVLQRKQTYLTNDAAHDPLILSDNCQTLGLRSVLCVPVFDAQEEVIAFFALYNKQGRGFDAADVETVTGISTVASIAIQNALAYRKISHTEEELRRLSTRLLNLQDEERRRIARELHESTAQELAALRMCVGRIARVKSRLSVKMRETLNECLALSDGLVREVRTLSYLLHPPVLDQAGLAVAVTWYASGFSKRSRIHVQLEMPDDLGRLGREQETALFRIVQEALTNVHRHSGSDWARIRIVQEDHCVLVEVEDRGRGIQSNTTWKGVDCPSFGVGLTGMRERLTQLRGSLEIASTPGVGTTVRALLPITGDRQVGVIGSEALKQTAG